MIYKEPSIYKNSNGNINFSLNLNDYDYESLIDDVQYLNDFSRRGTIDEYVRYYEELSLLSINLYVGRNDAVVANDWVRVFTLVSDKFWFTDYTDNSNIPVGVLGNNGGVILTMGVNIGWVSNKNLLVTALTANKSIDFKDVLLQDNNYGAVINRSYVVVKK